MGFIGIMLAVFCGIILYDLAVALMKVTYNRIQNREERKIGFGNDEPKKPAKGTQMRKIGFGEND